MIILKFDCLTKKFKNFEYNKKLIFLKKLFFYNLNKINHIFFKHYFRFFSTNCDFLKLYNRSLVFIFRFFAANFCYLWNFTVFSNINYKFILAHKNSVLFLCAKINYNVLGYNLFLIYLPKISIIKKIINFKKSLFYLKNNLELKIFIYFLKFFFLSRLQTLFDITAIDYPEHIRRFFINYSFLSFKQPYYYFVCLTTNEWVGVFSLASYFASANWLEREVWDLFGVFFYSHPDLRRLLTDYGFFSHPLRKDFPLTGYFEIRYDDVKKRTVFERLNLVQELRVFFIYLTWHKNII